MNILKVKNLSSSYFDIEKFDAVKNVSFNLERGEFLGIAGESGCGKSTLGFSIINLLKEPGKITGGEIIFDNKNILDLKPNELIKMRWSEFSIVFQASMNALNPTLKIRNQIYDVFKAHTKMKKQDIVCRANELFKMVNIKQEYLDSYVHQLSGGMKQRIVIAIALALEPRLVIMDEPTTALDVVVQRRIIQEVNYLRKKKQFSIIYITHDLSLLVEISDKIAIMYAGEFVEIGPAKSIFSNPFHPYTKELINCFPRLTGKRERLKGIKGYPPLLNEKIIGCAYKDRCVERSDDCNRKINKFEVNNGHYVLCNLYKNDNR